MGNVVSIVLVYALQAAWMCQRIIDRDFSQNHGSRPKPIADESTETETDAFLPKGSSTPNNYLTRSPHRRSKLVKTNKSRKDSDEADRFICLDGKEKTRHRKRRFDRTRGISGPREVYRNFDSDSENYFEIRNRFRHRLGHRRAFSDFDNNYIFTADQNRVPNETTDDNHNLVSGENADETMISTVDQAILRLVVSRGCMTEKRNDFSAYSVL